MNFLRTTSLLSTSCAVLLLAACGSDGDDFSYDPIPYNQLPADAVVITTGNAEQIARDGFDNATDDTSSSSGAAADTPTSATKSTLDQVKRYSPLSTSESTDVAMAATYVDPCESGSIVIVDNGSSGTLTYENCTFSGITIAGFFSGSGTYDATTYYGTSTVEGGFTVSGYGQSISMGIYQAETWYETGLHPYTIDIDFAITGDTAYGGGYRFETVTPISGDDTTFPYPSAGVAIIYGANNTKLEITFKNDYSMTLRIDSGSGFVDYPGNPVSY